MIRSVGYEARRGIKWLAAARALSAGFNLVATLLTIRLLTPEHFGLAAVAAMIVGFISILNDAGLATSLVRTRSISDDVVDRTQGLVMLVNVAAYALLVVIAPLAERFFRFDGLTPVILVAGLQLLVIGPIAVPSALLQREMRFPVLAASTVLEGIVGGLATVGLAVLGAGVWALVVGPLIGSLLRGAFVLLKLPRIPRPRPGLQGMSEALSFGGTLSLAQVLWAAYSRADTAIVGRLLGNQALGIYSVAMQVATLPMEKLAGILNTVGLSAFASVQGDHHKLREKYLWVTRVAAGVVFPVFWGISSVSAEIAEVVLGAKWTGAALPLLLIALSVPLRFLSSLTEPVLLALGRADLSVQNVAAASLIMIPGFMIGSHWGLVGVAASWPIGYAVYFVYRMLVAVRAIGVPASTYWLSLTPPAAAGGLMYIVVSAARPVLDAASVTRWPLLITLVVLGALAYGAATLVFNRKFIADMRRLFG